MSMRFQIILIPFKMSSKCHEFPARAGIRRKIFQPMLHNYITTYDLIYRYLIHEIK